MKILEEELNIIKNYKAPKGFEVITEATKRMYSYEINKILGNCQLKESNRNRESNSVTKVMMESLFDNGVSIINHYRIPTEFLMDFTSLMEINIDLVNKYNLVQCDIPLTKCKKTLSGNISAASSEKIQKFDIYDAYKKDIFNNDLNSFMKDMKYIFTAIPYSHVDMDLYTHKVTERRGFYITCA